MGVSLTLYNMFLHDFRLGLLDFLHIISGERAKATRSLWGADEPAVITFLQYVDGVAL